jgi:hypothetical protein
MLRIYTVKKSFSRFPSPAGMSLTKLSLGGNNDVICKLFQPRENLVSDTPAGDGNIEKLFLRSRAEEKLKCLCKNVRKIPIFAKMSCKNKRIRKCRPFKNNFRPTFSFHETLSRKRNACSKTEVS